MSLRIPLLQVFTYQLSLIVYRATMKIVIRKGNFPTHSCMLAIEASV